jgi:hypothetical protein
MTRERSGSFTVGSRGRTKPFSTTPATARGRRRRPRWTSTGDGDASGGNSGGATAAPRQSAHRARGAPGSAGQLQARSSAVPLRRR